MELPRGKLVPVPAISAVNDDIFRCIIMRTIIMIINDCSLRAKAGGSLKRLESACFEFGPDYVERLPYQSLWMGCYSRKTNIYL